MWESRKNSLKKVNIHSPKCQPSHLSIRSTALRHLNIQARSEPKIQRTMLLSLPNTKQQPPDGKQHQASQYSLSFISYLLFNCCCWFFEKGHVAQASLKLIVSLGMTLNLWFSCICLQSVGIGGVCLNTQVCAVDSILTPVIFIDDIMLYQSESTHQGARWQRDFMC